MSEAYPRPSARQARNTVTVSISRMGRGRGFLDDFPDVGVNAERALALISAIQRAYSYRTDHWAALTITDARRGSLVLDLSAVTVIGLGATQIAERVNKFAELGKNLFALAKSLKDASAPEPEFKDIGVASAIEALLRCGYKIELRSPDTGDSETLEPSDYSKVVMARGSLQRELSALVGDESADRAQFPRQGRAWAYWRHAPLEDGKHLRLGNSLVVGGQGFAAFTDEPAVRRILLSPTFGFDIEYLVDFEVIPLEGTTGNGVRVLAVHDVRSRPDS